MTSCIIQARMGSTRLPGKVMMDLVGKPMLARVVERCQAARRLDLVVVATSIEPADDVIAEWCQRHGVAYHRGSALNVLERYYHTATRFAADPIVRVTCDCPLIDPTVIDACLETLEREQGDYTNNICGSARPPSRGLDDVEAFRFRALEDAYRHATLEFDREHVTPFIWKNSDQRYHLVPGPRMLIQYMERPYRLTVDYPEDVLVVRSIYEALSKPEGIIGTEEIIQWLDGHPEVARLNQTAVQKTSYA